MAPICKVNLQLSYIQVQLSNPFVGFSLFESSQSLFWASFGLVDLSNFELSGIKSYTRFWGLMMFGSYSVINVVVLLNLLIAMMSNSYSLITVRKLYLKHLYQCASVYRPNFGICQLGDF